MYLLFVILAWSVWCLLMALWPTIFANSIIRSFVRVGVVLIPAVVFYWRHRRDVPIRDYFLLRDSWLRGMVIGFGVVSIFFGLTWLAAGKIPSFSLPSGFTIWFNFILGSPFAEEIFFRGYLLQELIAQLGRWRAVVISALAFALLHLPQWLLLDNLAGFTLLSSFTSIFIYGVVFALLVLGTKSLWAALIPHWSNNFILLAIET